MKVIASFVLVLVLLPAFVRGATVYQTYPDYPANGLGDLIAGNGYASYGDEINLAGTARQITSISIPFTLFNDTSDPSTTALPYTPDLTLTLYKDDGTTTSSSDTLGNGLPVLGNKVRPGTVIASSRKNGPTFLPLFPNNDTETVTFNFPNTIVPGVSSYLVTQNNEDGTIGANQFQIGISDVGGVSGPKRPQLVGTHNGFTWVQDPGGQFEATDYGYGSNFGPGYLTVAATVTAVPEPSTFWLAAAAIAGFLSYRQLKTKRLARAVT